MVVLYSNLLCAESVDVEVLIQMLSFYPVNASYLDIFLPSFPCEGPFNLIFKKDDRLGLGRSDLPVAIDWPCDMIKALEILTDFVDLDAGN